MVDEKKIADDEYQFPQEEYVVPDENPEAAASAAVEEDIKPSTETFGQKIVESYRSSNLGRNKRLILIVIVVVVLFLLSRLGSFFSHTNTVKQPVAKPVAQQQTELPPPAEVQPAAQPVVQQQPIMMNDDYRSQTDSKIQALQQQLSNIQDSLNASQNTNETLQNSITQLTAQVQTLSAQLKQTMGQQKKQSHQKQVVFYLRAVVPDRAWVMTSSGETVSVTVGDSLDQYGTIQSIDPVYGVIQTSSGRKITYGANDY